MNKQKTMRIQTIEGLILPEQRTAFCQQFHSSAPNLFFDAPDRCGIDGTIAAAHFFAPDFTLFHDCVFLTALMPPGMDEASYRQMEQRCHCDHSAMERWVNAWSIGDFFLNADSKYMEDDAVLTAFADCLRYHWGERLRVLFPERQFIFETGDEIEGELGYSITFYQKRGENP